MLSVLVIPHVWSRYTISHKIAVNHFVFFADRCLFLFPKLPKKKLFLNKQIDTEEQKIHIKKYILIILISKVLNNFFDYYQVKISYRRFNEIYFTDLLYTKLISVTVCIQSICSLILCSNMAFISHINYGYKPGYLSNRTDK